MKKLNYLLLGLAGIAMASCSQEDLKGPAQGDGNVNITVKLPGDLTTRALPQSSGLVADKLLYAVYDNDNDNLFVSQGEAEFNGELQTTVSFNLPQDKSYNIAFFAVSEEGTKVYDFQGKNGIIEVNYDNYTSAPNLADAYDCFYKLHYTGVIGSGTVYTEATLIRPVAQINWGTNDLNDVVAHENAFGENGKYIVSNLEIAQAYTQFSLLKSDVVPESLSSTPVTIEGLASPVTAEDVNWVYPVNPTVYTYVAMQYVLAPASEYMYDLSLNVDNSGHEGDATIQNDAVIVNNAPVQANFQTNIYGSLLTDDLNITVDKNPNWTLPSYNVENTSDFLQAVANGGTVTLFGDVYLPGEVGIKNNVTIDLNGYNIHFNQELPEDGTQSAVFYVSGGGSLEINGNGNIYAPVGQYGVWVNNANSVVTINGGNFVAGYPVYVLKGKAYITGGTFEGLSIYDGHPWVLNCQDTNYKAGTADIIVTGGTFIDFDPSNNAAEGAGTSFLPENGYKVVETSVNGKMQYTVVSDGTVLASTPEELEEAANDGNDVVMTDDITITTANQSNGYGATGISIKNGQTFDGNNYTLSVPAANSTWASAISTTGGVIKNLTIARGFRGIFVVHNSNVSSPVILENVILNGVTYTISCDQANYQGLTATNCTFDGWTSYAASLGDVVFNNCNFGEGNGYKFMRPYAPTTLNGCHFSQGFVIDAQAPVTFINCYFNGVLITSENVGTLVTSNSQNATVK